MGNWAFKDQTEEKFVDEILKEQPFIPSYFPFNVDMNRNGAGNVQQEKYRIPIKIATDEVEKGVIVVDVRDEVA